MENRFADNMVIHCPDKECAEYLIAETDVPDKNSETEALSGWDKYREKTVYGLMWKPAYENPTLVWCCSIDDETLKGVKITEYSDLLD